MNPEQILQDVSNDLFILAEKSTGRIHVLYNNGAFEVVSSAVYTNPVKAIASFKAEDIRAGLTVDQWNSLRRKIAAAMKEPK